MAIQTHEPLRSPLPSGAHEYIELPSFDCEVGNLIREFKPLPQDEHGIIYPQLWEIYDNKTNVRSLNILALGYAAEPTTNTWIIGDTAWSTQPDSGLNVDWARKFMDQGYNVLFKGPEIGSSLPLTESAFNTHVYLDRLEELGYLDASQVAVKGYSRGAMIGFGTNAYADRFDRSVLYSELIDPCVALPIRVDAYHAKQAIELPSSLFWLGMAVVESCIEDPERGKHLLQTVEWSPRGLLQFLRTGRPLFNGDAGRMAQATPLDMEATVTFCKHSPNDSAAYRKILEDRFGISFIDIDDGHGGGLRRIIMHGTAQRFGRLAQQLAEGRNASELDYEAIKRKERDLRSVPKAFA